MPWMCLEDCGFTPADISSQIAQLATPGVFTDVAFEDWDLENGVVVKKSARSQVSTRLNALGLGTQAMIVSWDLLDIRPAFENPARFIDSVVTLLLGAENVTAVNLDFEPHGSNPPLGPMPTKADGAAYAAFLTTFSDAMHERGVKVSVDIATWTSFWDYDAIGKSSVDLVCDMESYNSDFSFFQKQVIFAQAHLPAAKYVCGLLTTHDSGPNAGKPFNASEVSERFAFLNQRGVHAIGIWDTPMPSLWMPFLATFK